MKLPTLYKNKNGKTQLWEISCDLSIPRYIVRHGYQGGSIQETYTDVLEGKNIGRANQTTATEQCISEAKALWERQRDRKGYSEDIRAVPALKPMLAHDFFKHEHKVKFPVYVQNKFDGCVSGDTLIETKEYGYKPIKWLVDNNIECHVRSLNIKNNKKEYKLIKYHFKDKISKEKVKWYEVILESGEKLILTGNHLVFIPELLCWRRVDELNGTENLMVN